MSNLITEQEVFDIALNRDITPNLIKPSQIKVAQSVWVGKYFIGTLYDRVLSNPSDYTTFIDEYLKPIVAWGTIYNNFEYITTQITDKGVIRLLVEDGAAPVGEEAKLNTKREIRKTVYELIKLAQMYAESERDEGNSLFSDYESPDSELNTIKYHSYRDSYNQIPY